MAGVMIGRVGGLVILDCGSLIELMRVAAAVDAADDEPWGFVWLAATP